MKKIYLVEVTQQQDLVVSVEAESGEQAIELVNAQQGEIVTELPVELLLNKSRIIRADTTDKA